MSSKDSSISSRALRTRKDEEAEDTPISSRSTSPVLPEEETKKKSRQCLSVKQVVVLCLVSILLLIIWKSRKKAQQFSPEVFLKWVAQHPNVGLGAIVIVMAVSVVVMIPLGTPITLGCGYIYKKVYGWSLGIVVGTLVSCLGSAAGAISCFLLGRYLMRSSVKRWIRNYPTFQSIDVAISQQGLRIMAMLYLTPILPLGPVSYMCGTTSMLFWHFCVAKVASIPLMSLYVFLGASASSLMGGADSEESKFLVLFGMLLSAFTIFGITHYIRKELNKILEHEKRTKDNHDDEPSGSDVEMAGVTTTTARHRRHVAVDNEDAVIEGT